MVSVPMTLAARQLQELKGKVTDDQLRPLAFATIRVSDGSWNISTTTRNDGSFTISFNASDPNFLYSIQISYVGKASYTSLITQKNIGTTRHYKLLNQNLKLPEVEVNGVRRAANSNSSIIFDREAIEQTQALSLANVMNYLPGQTIVKPVVSVQGNQNLTMRSATSMNSVEALNNAFGINFQIDGNVISNDANMQFVNPGRQGLFGSNNIQNPEQSVIRDRSYRNGTMYASYANEFQANNGIDMRSIPAENVESIEVISGVASARYGDYTTGLVNIQRQAGVTPWRVNLRTAAATQNIGINKGFVLNNGWGAINIGLDHLTGKDDPTNSLKTFRRTSASLLWSYQHTGVARFKNTLSIDASTNLDQTKLDPDLAEERIAHMKNERISISNRASWTYKRNWFYDFQVQGSYSIGKQDSYDQYYLNTTTVRPMTNAMEDGLHEGYYIPGYYLAYKQVIGKPVNISARAETNSLIRIGKHVTNKLSIGINYSYSANKGAGVILDPDRPRFPNLGNKNDRMRPYNLVPSQSNIGLYAENAFKSRIFSRPLSVNIGVRGDIQNNFFTLSPRVNARYSITDEISWNIAFGIATKAPALSQISPGNVYLDIPVLNSYNGKVNESIYLAYTKVIELNNLDIRPYRSNTFETGLTWDKKPFHFSLYYFYRANDNGFTTQSVLLPIALPGYEAVTVPGQTKPTYRERDTTIIWNMNYNRVTNGLYNTTNGLEFSMGIDKIKSIQTSFNFNTAVYFSNNTTRTTTINLNPSRTDLIAVYPVYGANNTKLTTVKSAITSSTHIPALRMAVMLTGEVFWENSSYTNPQSILPVGYYTIDMKYVSLTPGQAALPEYQHLRRAGSVDGNPKSYNPPFVYPNIHMRLSKEIGDVMRFSFNAYNVFNIRPAYDTQSGTRYYNGQPSYGAELIFTIK